MKRIGVILIAFLVSCGGGQMEKSVAYSEDYESVRKGSFKREDILKEKLDEYVSYVELYTNDTLEEDFKSEAFMLIEGLVDEVDSSHFVTEIEVVGEGDDIQLQVGEKVYDVEVDRVSIYSSKVVKEPNRFVLSFTEAK